MKKYYYIFGLVVILVFTVSVISLNTLDSTVQTSGTLTGLSTKKIGWGIKRNNNHMQPDLGATNKKTIDEANGIAMGNSESKKVYLTFDEGYEAGYTPQILSTLKENNITATFFITAHYLNTQPELVKQMIDEGHIVGNHTVNHKSMPNLTTEQIKDEVMNLHTGMYEKFKYEMKYIRPPKGEYSEQSVEYCNTLRIYNSNVVICL